MVGAGASGAIFGLAGALIAALYLGKLPISKEAIRSTLKSLVAFAGYNLLFGLRPGVDNSAHLGGLVSGLAIGAALARHLLVDPDTRHRWRTYAFVVAALVLVMGTGFAAKRFHSSSESGVVSQAKDLEALQDALEALKRKDFQNAIPPLQGVIERNPRSVDAYYLLGLAYLGTNQPDEAIVQFKKALEINPRSSEVESGLAQAYEVKGMNAEADEANKKAEEFKQSDQ